MMNAFKYLNVPVQEISEPSQLDSVDSIVLPGVGSFPDSMDKINSLGILERLEKEVVEKGKPFLGICIGMQVLASVGHEFKTEAGFNFISGKVVQINTTDFGLRLPHIGWNECNIHRKCSLFEEFQEPPVFYFVHSFHFQPDSEHHIVATCEYGQEIISAIQKDNMFGVQFHPEKSQRDGLKLLSNFSKL